MSRTIDSCEAMAQISDETEGWLYGFLLKCGVDTKAALLAKARGLDYFVLVALQDDLSTVHTSITDKALYLCTALGYIDVGEHALE